MKAMITDGDDDGDRDHGDNKADWQWWYTMSYMMITTVQLIGPWEILKTF